MLLFENDNKIKQLKLHVLSVRGKCQWERKCTLYLMAFILKPICRIPACLKYTVSMKGKRASFCLQQSIYQFTVLLNSFPSPSYTFLLFYMGVKTKFSYFTKGLNNITALCGMCGSDSNNIVFMYDNIDMNDIYFNMLVTT